MSLRFERRRDFERFEGRANLLYYAAPLNEGTVEKMRMAGGGSVLKPENGEVSGPSVFLERSQNSFHRGGHFVRFDDDQNGIELGDSQRAFGKHGLPMQRMR